MYNQERDLKFWGRTASIYDVFMKKDKVVYDRLGYEIRKVLRPDMEVLELAAGTGLVSVRIAGGCKFLTATDYAEKMLTVLGHKKCPPNMRIEQADAANLQYRDKRFDAVVISNALHIVPKPELVLQNIARVLKDDGILIAPTFMRGDSPREKFMEKLMDMVGLHTYSPWQPDEYMGFIADQGWGIINDTVIKASFPIAFVIAGKRP